MLNYAKEGSTFLMNAPEPKDQVWNFLPREVQEQIIKKDLKFYCIDAYKVARESGAKESQYLQSLFDFSEAYSGYGETSNFTAFANTANMLQEQAQMKEAMSSASVDEPAAFERTNYF